MVQYFIDGTESQQPFPRQRTLNIKGKIFDLSTPQVMGIINVTPDSFYTGSRKTGEKEIRERIDEILYEGGTIVDVGGCSTRPGNSIPDKKEEMQRLIPVLKILRDEYPSVVVSVDTFHADIAKAACLEYGAHIINDISGGNADPEMFDTVARLDVPYILMHMRGEIATMHKATPYTPNVETAVLDFFIDKVAHLRQIGIKDIIIDPGYGFSKLPEDNYRLLAHSNRALRALALPILTGVSRKRMIWQTLESTPEEALNGTTVLNTFALLSDTADILRVHDVKAAVEAVKIVAEIKKQL